MLLQTTFLALLLTAAPAATAPAKSAKTEKPKAKDVRAPTAKPDDKAAAKAEEPKKEEPKKEEAKKEEAKKEEAKKEEAKKEEAKKEEAKAEAPLPPEVKGPVDAMQKFYEETKDFVADFEQTYTYKTFNRKQKSSGKVHFKKAGAAMRWDYEKPSPKVFVVAFNKVFMFDPEAKQVTKATIDTERLSASVTFLWGQGRLEREFNIKLADRADLKDGVALELTPKQPDPRFQRVFFLLDPKTSAVKETLVVDPDGSENRMAFKNVQLNTGFPDDVFKLSPPPDVQVIDMTKMAPQPPQGEKPAPAPMKP